MRDTRSNSQPRSQILLTTTITTAAAVSISGIGINPLLLLMPQGVRVVLPQSAGAVPEVKDFFRENKRQSRTASQQHPLQSAHSHRLQDTSRLSQESKRRQTRSHCTADQPPSQRQGQEGGRGGGRGHQPGQVSVQAETAGSGRGAVEVAETEGSVGDSYR